MADGDPRKRALPTGRVVTLAAAAAVLLLALGAMLWPHGARQPRAGGLLVLEPAGSEARAAATWPALAAFLAAADGRTPAVRLARNLAEFRAGLSARPAFVVCPDGVALGLAKEAFTPLAAGRRSAPRNLRPRSVLVYRKSAGRETEPWYTRPEATVAGDSLSLAATGGWRAAEQARRSRPTCAWGPDPYDHGPVLHAARLGCFDYAVVRQWDADRFFEAGLLDPLEWGVEPVTGPVPDLVLLAAADLPRSARMELGERLVALGRGQGTEPPAAALLCGALGDLGLDGFNLLVEPDFDLVRRSFAPDWLPGRD